MIYSQLLKLKSMCRQIKVLLKAQQHESDFITFKIFASKSHYISFYHQTPAELMFEKQLHTALHLVITWRANNILTKLFHKYEINKSVFVKNFGRGERYMAGKIIKLLGSRWVLVKRIDNIMCKHDVNQLHYNWEISQVMTKSENKILHSRDFDCHFDNWNFYR